MTWQVGKRYTLPSFHVGYRVPYPGGGTLTVKPYRGFTGWLPLLTPFHYDEDFFRVDFEGAHAHIAWQFVPQWFYDATQADEIQRNAAWIASAPQHYLLGHVVTRRDLWKDAYEVKPKRHTCLREVKPAPWFPGDTHWIKPLREKYACAALENGRCPHKGTPAAAFTTLPDGTRVCPAHGLRFNRQGAVVTP